MKSWIKSFPDGGDDFINPFDSQITRSDISTFSASTKNRKREERKTLKISEAASEYLTGDFFF